MKKIRLLLGGLICIALISQQVDWVTQVRRVPSADPRSYQFTSVNGTTASGNLSSPGASKSISLTPCPNGVSGTHTIGAGFTHYVYITGGIGTGEPVAIAGGSGGLNSCTIIVTTVNAHLGSWTVTSATWGIQEAIYSVGSSGRVLIPPANPIPLYGQIFIPASYNISLRGSGLGSTALATMSTTGTWISAPAGSYIDIGDFLMSDSTGTNHTSGAMLSISRSLGVISNLDIENGYDAIECVNCAGDLQFVANKANGAHFGLHFTSGMNQGHVTGGTYGGGVSGLRIDNTTVAGMWFSGVQFQTFGSSIAGNSAVSLRESLGLPINEVVFSGGEADNGPNGNAAFEFIGDSANYINNSVEITGMRLNGLGYCFFAQNKVKGIVFTGNNCTATSGTANLFLSDVQDSSFTGNKFVGDGSLSYGVQMSGSTNANLSFSGNQIGLETSPPVDTFAFAGGSNMHIVGNMLAASGSIFAGSLPTNLSVSGNVGIDNVIPVVASGSTVAFPINPVFTISGTTGVGTVTFPLISGARFMFKTTDGTVTFTAGATIGNTLTTTQNKPVSGYWDGTKVWLE